jgi:hypothetical protein
MKPNNIYHKQVVETSSALIEHAAEVKESIDDDHSGMAKFSGFDDEGYKQVSGAIEDYVSDIASNIQAPAASHTRKYCENFCVF